MQITATWPWPEPFTWKPQHIFALTFWFSIKNGLGIFKQLINCSSLKWGHLQSHSSWCVSVNWEFRKGAINSSRSWQIGIAVITLKFAWERCLTHYPWNLVSSWLSWNYCRTVNCLKWMKELICPLFILESMLPGCIQEGHLKAPISPWAFLPVIRTDDIICLVCIIWIRVHTLGPWFVLLFWVVHIPVLGNSVNSNTYII